VCYSLSVLDLAFFARFFCVVVYLCAFVVLDLVSSVLYAKRLAAKNISEMTYFVSSGT